MINCIVVDDEPLAIQLLKAYLEKVENINVVNTFNDPLKALTFLQTHHIDLIFLDIQMPQLSGIQLAKLIPSDSRVIFTTAYPDFALEGFEINAIDYLVKPIPFERLLKSISRFKATKYIPPQNEKTSFFVKTEHKLKQINLSDIKYIKGLGDYASIVTLSGKILTLETMKSLSQRLPIESFVRVHKSYIIQYSMIDFIERNRIKIDDEYIPIGQTYNASFWELIKSRQ